MYFKSEARAVEHARREAQRFDHPHYVHVRMDDEYVVADHPDADLALMVCAVVYPRRVWRLPWTQATDVEIVRPSPTTTEAKAELHDRAWATLRGELQEART